ncbi:hypothetical protein [Streptomyces sp. NPDC059909]|uniref:hypothetical protein n=1 Tax=Streptomyces sp. NPDC059909 TaxID=3346998 RepID=UPI00365307D9
MAGVPEACAMQLEPEPRYICSPEHHLMNASFVDLGALLVVGTALTGAAWRRGAAATVTRCLLAGAGVGFVPAGPAPADVHENQHVLGALLIMGTGNIGLLPAGVGLADEFPGPLRWVTSLLGVTALTASQRYFGLGMGGMERVAAFPILVWTPAVGIRGLLRQASRTQDAKPGRHVARATRR